MCVVMGGTVYTEGGHACMYVCVCAQYSSLEPVHTHTFICTIIYTYTV